MTRVERMLLNLANILVVGTGLAYGAMLYLLEPVDEFSVVNHPWQPHIQHLHVLTAPLLVFAVGLIWARHVVVRLRNGCGGRASGLGLVISFAVVASSGYMIQVVVEPGWRGAWIVIHLAGSLLWIAAFVIHQVRAWVAGQVGDRPETETAVEETR